MPINPMIPLQGQPVQMPNVMKSLSDVMGVRSDQIKLKQMQDAQHAEEVLKQAYGKYGMDPANREKILGEYAPVDPLGAEKIQQSWTDQDAKNRMNQQKIGNDNLVTLGVLADAAEFAAQGMVSNPQANWGKGVQHLKTLGQMAKSIGVQPEVVAKIEALTEVPDQASMQFVSQIPTWAAALGKERTALQMSMDAFYRTNGRLPNLDETFQLQQKTAAATTRQSSRFQRAEVMVPDGKGGKKRVLAGYDPETNRYYDQQGNWLPDAEDAPSGAQFPDQPPVVLTRPPADETRNNIIPGGTITEAGVWGGAESYILLGEIKQNVRSADPKQKANFDAIYNTAYARINNEASLPELRATYAALNGGQKQLMKTYLQTSAFVDSATQGIEQLRSVSDSYPRQNVPVINDMKLWWNRNMNSDPNLSELEVWVFNAARDYAKATSGSAGSVQQMTDAQIKASELLFSLRQGPESFERAAQTMLSDMKNQVNAQRKKLGETRAGMLDLLDSAVKRPWISDDAPEAKRGSDETTGAAPQVTRVSDTEVEWVDPTTKKTMRSPFATKEQADAFVAKVGGSSAPTPAAAGQPSTERPANPKKGDKWKAPNGDIVTWDGTMWK